MKARERCTKTRLSFNDLTVGKYGGDYVTKNSIEKKKEKKREKLHKMEG